MAEPEGGDDAGAYGTPAHSIPMVSGGHGSIHEPEIKSGIAGIPTDAEKSAERPREPITSPDLIAKATAADARLLGSRRSSRTPSIERSAEREEQPKSVAAIAKAIHQLDERVEDIEVAKFEADRAASAEKRTSFPSSGRTPSSTSWWLHTTTFHAGAGEGAVHSEEGSLAREGQSV